jgi:hypothetical protein
MENPETTTFVGARAIREERLNGLANNITFIVQWLCFEAIRHVTSMLVGRKHSSEAGNVQVTQ